MAVFEDILEGNVLGTGSPARKLFLEDSTTALQVKRSFSGLTKTGTGTGDLLPYGDHTHTTNKSYRVVIDTAGDENDATFKWSDDGGASFIAELVPVSFLARTLLQNAMTVLFAYGTYDLNDRWDWTAIATGSQLYDLQVDTTNSIVKIGRKLYVANDANFTLEKLASSDPTINFDPLARITFLRATEEYIFLAHDLVILRLTETFATIDGWLNLSAHVRFLAITTPATPSAGYANLYGKGSPAVPYWLDANGVESPIPQSVKAQTISGAWTFSAAGTAVTVTNTLVVGTVSCVNMLTNDIYVPDLSGSLHFDNAAPKLRANADLTILGYSRVGSTAAPTNVTAGDLTVVRLNVGNVAFGTGVESVLGGDDTLSGFLRVGSNTAPANTTAGDFSALRAVLGTDAAMPASTSVYINAAIRINANIGFFNATPQTQKVQGATLTNNITAGGTANQLDNWTSLAVYATDAAAIRNAVYQSGQTLKTVVDALRAYGLLT